MKWRVQVTVHSSNRRLLEDILGAVSVRILERDGKQFLVSDRFEAYEGPASVRAAVSRIQCALDEARKHDSEIDCSFSIGSIVERRAEGDCSHHHLVVASARHLHVAGHVASIRMTPARNVSDEERKAQEAKLQEIEYQRLRAKATIRIVSAVADERVLAVQQLLREQQTPLILGHIVEIIQSDLGSRIKELVAANQLSRFERSINHPEVFGRNARHIVSPHGPPPKPMNLGEAQAFVQEAAEKWFVMKARVAGDA